MFESGIGHAREFDTRESCDENRTPCAVGSPEIEGYSILMNDVRIIQDGLLLNHASSSDSLATLRSDVIEASATSTNSSASHGLANSPLLADRVMNLSATLSRDGCLPRYQRSRKGQSDCKER